MLKDLNWKEHHYKTAEIPYTKGKCYVHHNIIDNTYQVVIVGNKELYDFDSGKITNTNQVELILLSIKNK